MQLIALIVSIIKALPVIERMFVQIAELYFQAQEARDQSQAESRASKREEILNELKRKDLTDEERDKLRRDLYSIIRR